MAKKVVIYTTGSCSYCRAAKDFLKSKKVVYDEIDVTRDEVMREKLAQMTGQITVPQILVDGKSIGGYEDLLRFYESGQNCP